MFKYINGTFFSKLFNQIIKIVKWIINLPSWFIRANLSHNTSSKIFSFVLAIVFWIFVMDQVDPEIIREFTNVPVQLINVQELQQRDLKIMDQHDYFVDVQVQGRRNNVLSMQMDEINLWSDMRNIRPGINNVFINRSINSDSISILDVKPNELVIAVDRIVSVPKPVMIVYNDTFQPHYFQIDQVINPENVRVVGPESIVRTVEYVGSTMSVNAFTSDTFREITLLPYDDQGEVVPGVSLERSQVGAQIIMGKRKTVPLAFSVEGLPMEGYQVTDVEISKQSVQISGPVNEVRDINEVLIDPIQLNGEEKETFTMRKSLGLPSGVNQISEDFVEIKITIEPLVTKNFSVDWNDIPVLNLKDHLTFEFLNEDAQRIQIEIKAVESILESISLNQLSYHFDFSGIEEPGVYRMNIDLMNTENFESFTWSEDYVEVHVKEKVSSDEKNDE